MSNSHPYLNNINAFFKWVVLCLVIGIIIGTITAFFLSSLEWVTAFRGSHQWVIYGLPLIGLCIGLLYHYAGSSVQKGNNVLIESHNNSEVSIPFKLAPLVLIGTLLTHLVGGSAGREGTAVQMGGSIAAPFSKWFKLNETQRKTIIIMGISAGFAAVFGTPWAGAIFAIELMSFKKIKWEAIIPTIVVAFIAHYTCIQWGIQHSSYHVNTIASFNFQNIGWALLAGILFGLAALVFTLSGEAFKLVFNAIKWAPLRPLIGGIILLCIYSFFDAQQWMGLGLPTISASFESPVVYYDFLIKIVLTSFTLSAGFKGGEVTPLFFIGATLGNILILFFPLPMGLLAAMGFVAVFAGATHCVIASIILGLELFGTSAGVFIGVACISAYFSSGMQGIYSAQHKTGAKYDVYNYIKKVSSL
jgi:H+/Cl- antiporter ClcA